jgi:hypothetical protein
VARRRRRGDSAWPGAPLAPLVCSRSISDVVSLVQVQDERSPAAVFAARVHGRPGRAERGHPGAFLPGAAFPRHLNRTRRASAIDAGDHVTGALGALRNVVVLRRSLGDNSHLDAELRPWSLTSFYDSRRRRRASSGSVPRAVSRGFRASQAAVLGQASSGSPRYRTPWAAPAATGFLGLHLWVILQRQRAPLRACRPLVAISQTLPLPKHSTVPLQPPSFRFRTLHSSEWARIREVVVHQRRCMSNTAVMPTVRLTPLLVVCTHAHHPRVGDDESSTVGTRLVIFSLIVVLCSATDGGADENISAPVLPPDASLRVCARRQICFWTNVVLHSRRHGGLPALSGSPRRIGGGISRCMPWLRALATHTTLGRSML